MSGVRVGNKDNGRSGIKDFDDNELSDSLGVIYHWSQPYSSIGLATTCTKMTWVGSIIC